MISSLYIGTLLLACFVPNEVASNLIFALGSLLAAIYISFRLRKRAVHDVEKRQVTLLLPAFASNFFYHYRSAGTEPCRVPCTA